jgi:2-isopropylmalate synthase
MVCRHIKKRDSVIISLHTHNDRCTGVPRPSWAFWQAPTRRGTCLEMARGPANLDIVAVALNLYMQGIDPKLDFSDLNSNS